MKISIYEKNLPDGAKIVRHIVFVEEQGFTDEFDDIDNISAHLVMYDDDERPVATCRIFPDSKKDTYILGRLAVINEYRNKNICSAMIYEAEKYVSGIGGQSIELHAQCQAAKFYEKQGYVKSGDIDDEQGCPHVWMKKILHER